MSHAPGAYLGGIRTVQDVCLRCMVDEDTGCWHWRMAMSGGSPKVHFVAPDTGRAVSMRGRRAALYLQRGHDLPSGHTAFARLQCHSKDCVNPAHCRGGTRQAHGQWMQITGVVKGLPSKAAASRRIWDKRGRVLTPAMVAEIRASSESAAVLARRFKVSAYAVYSCRRGITHRQDLRGASVFTWGLA